MKISNHIRMFCLTVLAGTGFILEAAAQTGNISGRVLDKESAAGIPFANVVLVNAKDSTQVMGTPSSDSGSFAFKRIPAGRYFVQVAVLGYHRSNSPTFVIDAEHREHRLEPLLMTSASVQLDKVVIRAKRPMMEMEAGKITMNVSQSLVTQADNAFEMLKKFPGVTIDKDDNISLNGKGGVLITVDDRQTHLSGESLANYLRGMPANTIDKIEVMNNPSSKYDAEGTGGIINFKTNRLMNSGFSGNINGSYRYSTGSGGHGGLDLNYRHKKFTFYVNGSVYGGENEPDIREYTRYADGSLRERVQNKEKYSHQNYFGFYGKGGIDLYLSSADVMSLAYQGYSGRNRTKTGIPEVLYPNPEVFPDSAASSWVNRVWQKYNWQSHTVNFNYEHKFDTVYDRKLSLNLEYVRSGNGVDYNNASRYYPASRPPLFEGTPTRSESSFLEQPFKSNIYSLKLDYEHPFNMQTRLEAGIKFSYVDNNSVYRQRLHYMRPSDTTSRNIYDNYLYDEMIGAAYLMVNHTFKSKTSLQVGIRAEYTRTKGNNRSMDSINVRQYIRPFPNITISQPIGNKNQLSLSYRYRLSRPDYSTLNPFVLDGGTGLFRCGNPFLDPEYSHNLDLSYSYNYKFFATLSYIHTDGSFTQVSNYVNNNGFMQTYTQNVNAGKGDFVSLNLSTQLTFFKIWRLNVFLNGSYGKSEIRYANTNNRSENFNASWWLNTEVDATSFLTFSAYSYGNLPSRSHFERIQVYYGAGLGAKAFFLEKTLTLSAAFDFSNPYTHKEVYPTPEGNVTTWGRYAWGQFGGRISLSWRFGNMNGRGPRQLERSDESSRLGGGGGGNGGGN